MRAKILIFFYKYYKCFAKNLGMFYEKHLDIFLFFVQKPATFVRFFLKGNDSYPNRQASSIKNVRTSLFEGVRTL